MLKQSQYLSGDSFKPSKLSRSKQRTSSNYLDNNPTPTSHLNSQIENCTQQRFLQIKKKYGAKEKPTTNSFQASPLSDITHISSNHYATKDYLNLDKYAADSHSKSIMICHSNFKDEQKKNIVEVSHFQQSLVRRIDESRDIPRFGGRTIKSDTNYISKSIQALRNQPHEQKVESIDKINLKICQILSCLNENSGVKQFNKSQLEIQSKSQGLMKNQNLQNLQKHRIAESRIYAQNGDDISKKYYIPGKINRRLQTLEDRTRRYSMNHILQSSKMKSSYLPDSSQNNSYDLKNKDIDEQIRRISERMKKSNEQKMELNISSSGLKNKQLSNCISSYIRAPQSSYALLERRNRMYSNAGSQKLKTEYNGGPISSIKTFEKAYNLQRSSNREGEMANVKSKAHLSSLEIDIPKIETKRLIDALKKQIDLDESLRNSKVRVNYSNIQNKWKQIKQLLENRGVFLSLQQVQRELSITLQQHNPFFSVRESDESIGELTQKYIQSYNHWTKNVQGKFDSYRLKQQGFCQDVLDLQKKGVINIEDMVRFMNFQTKNFYRNRDIVLLFRRLSSNTSIGFQRLMNTVCK